MHLSSIAVREIAEANLCREEQIGVLRAVEVAIRKASTRARETKTHLDVIVSDAMTEILDCTNDL